ncbi:high affinity cAMP-specific and IBMX-insensitive 3',5'-cyclic phosphodiesterase 8 isoform X2 [Episyrphus balteatus]|uniref:high affinity cAMP-specific and IBMX-insensitive 3',5'-cyclic phosphodiesterase 8 isoform X2 n=1 Tax=Episyrphus balteatus TaxID=286459 RepID=UPI00248667B7|nr:high affinity cAMP-specific and IBMX-insensitive 3',5'-cyclic phosphodiesterase 8 isoform X2 [Episyrphus balteatus]
MSVFQDSIFDFFKFRSILKEGRKIRSNMRNCFIKMTNVFRKSKLRLESQDMEVESFGQSISPLSEEEGSPKQPTQGLAQNSNKDKTYLITKPQDTTHHSKSSSYQIDKRTNKNYSNTTSISSHLSGSYQKNSNKSCKSYQTVNKCVIQDEKTTITLPNTVMCDNKNIEKTPINSDDDSCHSVQLRVKIPPYFCVQNGCSLTPEEIEYERNVFEEGADIATPLPSSKQVSFTDDRPEIAEVLKNLDSYALQINNLTVEDKSELINRFTKMSEMSNKRSQRSGSKKNMKSHKRSGSNKESVKKRGTGLLVPHQQPRGTKLQLENDNEFQAISDNNSEKSVMDLKYPTVLPPNPQLKALLVFHKTDNVCDVFTTACHRQQLEVTLVKSKELALDTLQNNANMDNFHLIIIDARSSKYLDAEYITRSIRHTTGYHFTTIIAVVKKSFFDKDELPLIALLDAGVNRCISETTSVPICCTELKQILHSIVRPHNVMSTQQENCSADEAKLIDKVMEFLKREGLYSPQMKEIRTEDPIATDLIGALLTGPNIYSSRRSSNDSIIRTSTSRPSGILPAKMKATPLIMELLEESLSWEFDIFKLEEITEHRPLLYLGMEMFRRFDVFATFNVEENVFKTWLAVIEAHYHSQNTYHNSTHAADVMQATGAFMTQLAAKEMVMDRMDEATALIASAAHDIDHPGRSSAFLCNSNSPLAIMYNDLTVLESHHAATTFKLTLGDDKINIFKNLDKDTYKSVRSVIIDMILATEMTRHFENLAKFVSVFGADVEPKDIVQSEDDSQLLIRRMLIKVADVSNPARPLNYCVEWARRIAEEYFTQTDEEKANSLPIVMPMFDRATCSIPKSQIGFIEFIIQDMIHAWDSFIDMPHLITHMQQNYSQWKKFEEQGVHTLADIKNKQVTLSSTKGTFK